MFRRMILIILLCSVAYAQGTFSNNRGDRSRDISIGSSMDDWGGGYTPAPHLFPKEGKDGHEGKFYDEQDEDSHRVGFDRFLYIEDSERLELYLERAKKAVLKCNYFKNNYSKYWKRLETVEQQPNLVRTGYLADDGHRISHRNCAEWVRRGETYYNGQYLNTIKSKSGLRLCYWESTIPHEVLHTAGMSHDTVEQEKVYTEILLKCDLYHDGTMKRWWYKNPKKLDSLGSLDSNIKCGLK